MAIRLNRRNFLKLAGAAVVTTAGATLLDTYAPWVDYDEQAEHSSEQWHKDPGMTEQKMQLVRFATMAANGHNTQPWKFAIKGYGIQILPDYNRRLSVVDPNDREMWISLGCALENLLLAARVAGFAVEVTYPDAAEWIDIRLAGDSPQKSALFDFIPLRQNTRLPFDGRPVDNADLDQIQNLTLEPGITLYFAVTPADLERWLEYINQGNLQQYADRAFVEELITWLRFNKKEALNTMDGLYSRCSGNPEVPRFIGRMFVSGIKPEQQAEADAKKMRSSAGAVVIASEADDRTSWVRTGQVYERLALKLTSLNIKSALLNQPIEVAGIRPQFQRAIGLKDAKPQLMARFGYAEALPRSLRRPVSQVLVES